MLIFFAASDSFRFFVDRWVRSYVPSRFRISIYLAANSPHLAYIAKVSDTWIKFIIIIILLLLRRIFLLHALFGINKTALNKQNVF